MLLNVQSYIPKPQNIGHLLDSTEQEFRETTDFNKAQFRSMQVGSSFSTVGITGHIAFSCFVSSLSFKAWQGSISIFTRSMKTKTTISCV
jgi:hypothetical protein